MPHWNVLDLSVVAYVRVDNLSVDKTAHMLVKHEHLHDWGQDEAAVYEAAKRNMLGGRISFTNISHVITNLLREKETDYLLGRDFATMESPLFVLTNTASTFGAVFMVFPEIMEKITAEMQDDVYVIPSSVHESLVVAVSKIDDLAYLRQVVYDVNRIQMPLAERLSDHVYLYRRGEGLSIAK